MKKLMLTMLVAMMFATPCLAEVETDNLLTLEGTLWYPLTVGGIGGGEGGIPVAFYGGRIFYKSPSGDCCESVCEYFFEGKECISQSYADHGTFSTFEYLAINVPLSSSYGNGGILLPQLSIGFGYLVHISLQVGIIFAPRLFLKIADGWTPPEGGCTPNCF